MKHSSRINKFSRGFFPKGKKMSVSSKELFSSLAPGQDPSGLLLTGPGVGL